MENEIKTAFDEIIDEQIHQIAYKKCIKDPEYQTTNTKAVTLMDLLRISLSNNEQRKLLNELESALYIVESIFLEYSYRQGIEDSQMIRKKMETFGIEVTKENINTAL